jgi:hypothetical protein
MLKTALFALGGQHPHGSSILEAEKELQSGFSLPNAKLFASFEIGFTAHLVQFRAQAESSCSMT